MMNSVAKKTMMPQKNSYTLAEMAIVIAIISMIMGVGFSALMGGTTSVKLQETYKKMDVIEKAIANFLVSNQRLPCPANIALKANDSNSGSEYCGTSCVSYSVTPSLPASYTCNGMSNVYIGSVPFKALGLGEEFLFDGWQNKFVYYVTAGASGTNISGCSYSSNNITPNMFNTCNMGVITIKDYTGAIRANNAMYAIMSTGSDGAGGFTRGANSRTTATAPASGNQLVNYNSSSTAILVAQEIANGFDDIVHYKMAWQIANEAGFPLGNQILCSQVSSSLNISGSPLRYVETLLNNVNYSSWCGNRPGDPLCASYLNILAEAGKNLCVTQ